MPEQPATEETIPTTTEKITIEEPITTRKTTKQPKIKKEV